VLLEHLRDRLQITPELGLRRLGHRTSPPWWVR
jgi:hypothetical protein